MKKSLITMIAALALVGVVGAGATLAYLTDATNAVTNTFTVGKVDIELTETVEENGESVTGNDYTDILPGDKLYKKPVVTVKEGSSSCYVFVKVDNTTEGMITFAMDSDWKEVTEGSNVYYQLVSEEDAKKGTELVVFDGVTVDTKVTENNNAKLGDIVIQAAAVQADNLTGADKVAAAYDVVKNDLNK